MDIGERWGKKINVPGRHKRFQLENQNDRTWSKIIANSNGLQACLSLFYFDIYTYSYCAIRFFKGAIALYDRAQARPILIRSRIELTSFFFPCLVFIECGPLNIELID